MPTVADDISQSSPLIQRLDRRRTEPLGIIDVRQPQNIYARTAGQNETRIAVGAERVEATTAGGELTSALPLAKPPSPVLSVQHQQEGLSAKSILSMEQLQSYKTAVAAEIPVDLTKPDMVWRKSSNEPPAGDFIETGTNGSWSTSLPLRIDSANRNAPAIARQEATPASAAAAPEPPISATAQTREIDLERLTERVSRTILRQLAVERERRGIGRWH